MAEENPLVAKTNSGSWTGAANVGNADQAFEGSGLFADVHSTISDGAKGNWGGVAMDAAGDAMDALGTAMDPLGSLAGAGIGWLIEHVGFLKKPLDLLAGDPEAVTAKAQTWTNVANTLNQTAQKYQGDAANVADSHKGDASQGYQATVRNFTGALQGAATHAQSAAKAMNVAATIVGTTRGVIRDSLSQFAGDAIVKFAAATALAPISFGASEAAFVADEVAEGASLAAHNGSKLTEVTHALGELGDGAKNSSRAIDDAAKGFGTGAKDATKAADTATKDATKAGDTAAKDATKAGDTAPKSTAPDQTPTHGTDTSGVSDSSAAGRTEPASTAPQTTAQHAEPGDTAPHSTPDQPSTHNADAGGTSDPSSVADSGTPSSPSGRHAAEETKPTKQEWQRQVDKNKQELAANKEHLGTKQDQLSQAKHDLREAKDGGAPRRGKDGWRQHEVRSDKLDRDVNRLENSRDRLRDERYKVQHEPVENANKWIRDKVFRGKLTDDGPLSKINKAIGEEGKQSLAPGKWYNGVPKPSLADGVSVVREAGAQTLSDQPTRQDNVAEDYAKEHGGEGAKPAEGTADPGSDGGSNGGQPKPETTTPAWPS